MEIEFIDTIWQILEELHLEESSVDRLRSLFDNARKRNSFTKEDTDEIMAALKSQQAFEKFQKDVLKNTIDMEEGFEKDFQKALDESTENNTSTE